MRACLLLLVCACGGSCPGPGDAGVAGVVATSASDTATYGNFRWGANNDCPAAGSSPDAGHVVSVTVIGEQVGSGMMAGIGLCFPRPDLIDAPIDLSDTTKVLFESMTAQVGDCRYTKAVGTPLGTVSFGGFCTQMGAAFSIHFSGGVPANKQCGGGPTELVTMSLSGSAAVTARQ